MLKKNLLSCYFFLWSIQIANAISIPTQNLHQLGLSKRAALSYARFKLDSTNRNFQAAFLDYQQYNLLNDSILISVKEQQLKSLQQKYQTTSKDINLHVKQQHIELLQKQQKFQDASILQTIRTRNLIVGSAALILMLLALIIIRYRIKLLANRKLKIQQVEILSQNDSLQTMIQQKNGLLAQKEWLMKEVHHRVKNNLQVIISLLNIQSAYLQDDKALASLKESQNRMQSIALIHQKLYQSESRALINMPTYIKELVTYLAQSFDVQSKIKFQLDISPVELDVVKAVPIGLILNELITNSIKHAFAEIAEPKIGIELSSLGNTDYQLLISDNGCGLPNERTELTKNNALGTDLILNLSSQIDGELSVKSAEGLAIGITFNGKSKFFAVEHDDISPVHEVSWS